MTLRTYMDSPFDYRTKMSGGDFNCAEGASFRSDFGVVYMPLTWTSNDDLNLIGKLREQVAGSDFNLAVALAELPEALEMIGGTAIKIARAFSFARKGNFSAATEALLSANRERGRKLVVPRHAASNWLELQYGWQPLLKDVHGAAMFAAQQLECPFTKVIRVRVRKNPVIRTSSPSNVSVTGVAVEVGQLIAYLTEKDVTKMVGLHDPLSVAWEKLPYSFVADWFIPISNFLSARAMASAITGSFVTTKYSYYRTRQLTFVNPVLTGAIIYSEAGCDVTRTVSSTLAVPLPSFKPLAKVASVGHCLNAIALLTTAFWPRGR